MPAQVPVQYDYQPCWEDTRVVLYREYFACEAPTYLFVGWAQGEFGYSDDEMFALLWIARLRALALAEVMAEYGLQGQDLYLLCVQYGISMTAWYYEVDEDFDLSASYRPLYLAHWSGRYSAFKYRNADLIRLLHLRMACEYYGMKPREYLRTESSGASFRWQAQANLHRAGSTGVDCRHDKIAAPGERPWTCRDHNEWIQHQDAWARDQQIRNPLRDRETSPREREVARMHLDAECRSREGKMRADEAQRLKDEASAAASRPEHDRQVAEYERRQDAQARDRGQAQHDLVEHERRMAQYDRKKADYESQKEEWRRRSLENERRMSEGDRRAAAARRLDDEAKLEEAEEASKVHKAAALPAREGPQPRAQQEKPDQKEHPIPVAPEVLEARRRQFEQDQIDHRKKSAQENARHEEEQKAAGPRPDAEPQHYPGLRAGFKPERFVLPSPQAEKTPETTTGEHRTESDPKSERESAPRHESKTAEHNPGSRTPESEHRSPGTKEPERRETPQGQKQPPPPQKQAPPPPPPPPQSEKRPESSKSSDKDKDKK